MDKISLTTDTLLNMSIRDFNYYAEILGEARLWELFFQAQKVRDNFVESIGKRYISDSDDSKSK